MGLILITHDLAVVADMADRIVIMRDGEIVEAGETVSLFRAMRHPYTRALFEASSARSRRGAPGGRRREKPVLEVSQSVRDYALPRRSLFSRPGTFRAVDHVSLAVRRGENVGLVGESGCGKSTLTRAILALDPLQGGSVAIDGRLFHSSGSKTDPTLRRKVQVVFQDPYSSFDPRHRVERLVAEPFHLDPDAPRGAERRRRVEIRPSRRRPAAGRCGQVHPRIFRRSAPAHRHCAGADHRAGTDHPRRGRVGARRVDPRADPRPSRRPLRPAGDLLSLHLPRPVGGARHHRPRACHEGGADRRGRPDGRGLHQSATRLYQEPDRSDARSRTGARRPASGPPDKEEAAHADP